MKQSAGLLDLLVYLRGHAHFPELLKAVERPRISPFQPSEAAQSEAARAKWIHESGKLLSHEQWLRMLTGKSTSEQGDS